MTIPPQKQTNKGILNAGDVSVTDLVDHAADVTRCVAVTDASQATDVHSVCYLAEGRGTWFQKLKFYSSIVSRYFLNKEHIYTDSILYWYWYMILYIMIGF